MPERIQSRLMVVPTEASEFEHHHFYDLPRFLRSGDLLVFNDTQVVPARLLGRKASGGRVELLIERPLSATTALALMKSSKSPSVGSHIELATGTRLRVIGTQSPYVVVQIESPSQSWSELLQSEGSIPLPPYIQRAAQPADEERYQTVYARHPGAVAAPTAGLHFDDALMQQLVDMGVQQAFVTLHVGSGTFQPVRVQDIREHKMHAERLSVSESVCARIHHTRQNGGRVVAVGTTTVRALESAALSGELKPYEGDSSLFIHPGYRFRVCDGLITNFHLPASTLLMMVSAFAGYDRTMHAYRCAVARRYRFFSYGDAMLFLSGI